MSLYIVDEDMHVEPQHEDAGRPLVKGLALGALKPSESPTAVLNWPPKAIVEEDVSQP